MLFRLSYAGKYCVATEEKELPSLQKIFERGMANGVQCRRIDDKELHEIEPHARGVAAIHVPETGIVDYPPAFARSWPSCW